jgi:hypothetical protein
MIYSKNYDPGKNPLLKFNGYYCNRLKNIATSNGSGEFIYPVFFYADGAVVFLGAVKDSALKKTVSDQQKVWGYWGNYLISNDTITIETIGSYAGSFQHIRHISKGVIKEDSICLFSEIDRAGASRKVIEVIHFTPFDTNRILPKTGSVKKGSTTDNSKLFREQITDNWQQKTSNSYSYIPKYPSNFSITSSLFIPLFLIALSESDPSDFESFCPCSSGNNI